MNEDIVKERLGDRGGDGIFHDDKFVCNRIDYGKDAIIEASAGTGKTYTLQSIVLKLLVEEKIDSVKNILLVTYTEKAAGELKDRIRTVLEEAGCLPSDFDPKYAGRTRRWCIRRCWKRCIQRNTGTFRGPISSSL